MLLAFSLLAERRRFFQPVLLLRTESMLAHLFVSVKHSTAILHTYERIFQNNCLLLQVSKLHQDAFTSR